MSRKKQKSKNKNRAISSELKPLSEEKNIFDSIKGKEIYIALFLISIVAFFVFKDFLLFKKVMLYKDIASDTLNYSLPVITHTADYIHSIGLPSWSFNYGMGQNLFPFFLRDPFDIILYAIGKNHLAYGIGYNEFLKVILGGLFFFLYLRALGMNGYSCIAGGLLYSFTGCEYWS